jgi:hypothetical protein
MGPYPLLKVEGQTCTVEMRKGPTNFRSTIVKPYYEEEKTEPNTEAIPPENIDAAAGAIAPVISPEIDATAIPENKQVESDEDEQPPQQPLPNPRRNPGRQRRHGERYIRDHWLMDEHGQSTIFLTAKESGDLDLAIKLRAEGIITTPGAPFEASRKKETDGLLTRGVFKFIAFDPVRMKERIFGSRMVDEVKGKGTTSPYEKSRLVIQAYNDLRTAKLFVFVDGSFANNKDLSSQIGYIIILANEKFNDRKDEFSVMGNIIHYSSVKCKRVTRAVLASELYAMVQGIDTAIALSTTLKLITKQLKVDDIPTIICTDSFSLYECLVKLGTTKEKRLMIDIMAIRQSYERKELSEIRWINGQDNPADAMTKSAPTKALAGV